MLEPAAAAQQAAAQQAAAVGHARALAALAREVVTDVSTGGRHTACCCQGGALLVGEPSGDATGAWIVTDTYLPPDDELMLYWIERELLPGASAVLARC